MELIELEHWQLALASVLVILLAACSWWVRLGFGRSLIIAAVRTTVQLSLIGLVLEALFSVGALGWVALMGVVMVILAGREVMMRQRRRLRGGWAFGIGTSAMFVSAFTIAVMALLIVIRPDPWYQPQYAIPLLGMMLGNTMNGIALSLDRLTDTVWRQREDIEGRLMLGQRWQDAISDIRREAMRSGMIPTINMMAAAGLVSLPGMMTGQILAGSPPALAVKYQILLMFTIAAGTGFGTMLAVTAGSYRLFDHRQRLRTDRITNPTH